jgi:polyisoprenoid-binding protein YceI
VEKFPAMTFKSKNIDSDGGPNYTVTGELTIRGVAKSVKLTVEDVSQPSKDPWGNTRIGLSGITKINRKDFGLAWNSALETGGVLVGEEVTISLDIQFVKA